MAKEQATKRIRRRNVLILGAAGRDFHNFNVFFRKNKRYNVVGFTATQIPNIAERKYPQSLSGRFYPNGIEIYDEKELESLIDEYKVDEVYFSYSDVSHEHVMHLASRVQASGASFVLLGPNDTMLKSNKPVIAVCAVRTGSGKSPLTKKIATTLKGMGKRVVVVRHPMPYGDLAKQRVQRFARLEDLDRHQCTIEEREEYEPHISNGVVVYAGIDYEKILRKAEKEADIIIWDGGNNDFPFYRPDLLFVVADALRAGHEMKYYPGETNFRMADVLVVNKASENPEGAKSIMENAEKANPNARIVQTELVLTPDEEIDISGKKVIAVEDGPTVTHGEMGFGAAYKYAKEHGAAIISPKDHAVGSIKETFEKYTHLKDVLPAMGYYGEQLKDLEETIRRSGAEIVVSGTPVNLKRVITIDTPVLHITYSLKDNGEIERELKEVVL
ncbi:MAG: cyclic 2,3-diphosphoglycerate synthase [Candidatus Bilamarchaeaceae archaeon]